MEHKDILDMYAVNLNEGKRPDIMVCSNNMTIPSGKYSFSKPKGIYELKITEAVILDEGLSNPFVMKEGKSMFSIQFEETINTVHMVDVKGMNSLNFNVLFIPENILDCRWKENRRQVVDGNNCSDVDLVQGEDRSFTVRYTVTLSDVATGKKGESVTDEVKIDIAKFEHVQPAFKFIPKSQYADGIEYNANSDGPIEIGELRVSNNSKFLAAPAIDTTFELVGKVDEHTIPGLLTLGDPVETVKYWDRAGFLIPNDSAVPNDWMRETTSRIALRGLDTNKDASAEGNESYVVFPVYWNMDKIENPSEDVAVNIGVKFCSKKSYERRLSEFQEDSSNVILFKRNLEIIDLEISFDDYEDLTVAERNVAEDGCENVEEVHYPKNDPISVSQEFNLTLKLANTATAGSVHSAVVVKDFVFGRPVMENVEIELTGKEDMMSSLFSIEGDLASESSYFRLTQSESVDLNITYRPRYISSIKVDGETAYSAQLKFPYSFKYVIDKDGAADLKFVEAKGVVNFKVAQIASEEWLCVDFGSSAVVGAYGAGMSDEAGAAVDNIIKLKPRKEKCLLKCFPNLNDAAQKIRRTDVSESSDYLITSATSIDGVDIKESMTAKYTPDEFGKHAVCFSPSTGMQKQNIKHVMPCLKTLMGHEKLPANVIPDDLRQQGLEEVEVNHMFEAVYRQLFGCFLGEEAASAQKLIMSVPNTYSPIHLDILKNIAKGCMPNLRPDYTNFISESDAVACYYLANQLTFCNNSDIRPSELDNSNVLVYDMGAGTLDLTYFRQSKVDNRVKVSIDGKMGVSKAGSYLDYVLAEIVVDLIVKSLDDQQYYDELHLDGADGAATFKSELLGLLSIDLTPDKYALALQLKNYVQTMKRLLNSPDEQLPTDVGLRLLGQSVDSILKSYTIRDVLSHIKFVGFLKETTVDIFKHFVSLFGNDGKTLKIDVVIFSGRMTGIPSLRNAVKDALRVFMPSSEDVEKCRYADLASKKFVEINEVVTDVTDLKTVVVDGAMAFCTQFQRGAGQYQFKNRNLYATYGLIIRRTDGGVAWLPLVDYRTNFSVAGKIMSSDGITINQYDTTHDRSQSGHYNTADLIGLDGKLDGKMISEVYLVQSYSANTAEDWASDKKEMMTILGKYKSQPRPLSYRLKIDEKNELKFWFAGSSEKFMSHDDLKNTALRKSNWPIRFEIKKNNA